MTDGLGGAALVAVVALIPLVALMLTSFVKVSVVLALLRNAIGSPDAPSGLVVMGISLVLSFFVMAPVAIDMVRAAAPADAVPGGGASPPAPAPQPPPAPGLVPLDLEGTLRALVPAEHASKIDAGSRALGPLRDFLVRHAAPSDRDTFVSLAESMGRRVTGDELWILAPAFLTTELREAFAIAVLLFIPFLVLDLVVALGLSALGLQSTQPGTVALPLKLLLFVAVDGWRLLVEALLRGYL